jgi:nucleotide-binding universal stress UspA family protein
MAHPAYEFRSIVVGCDGSDQQAGAIALAETLRSGDGHLILANVFPILRGFALPALAVGYADELRKGAEAGLEAAAGLVSDGVEVELLAIGSTSAAAGLNDIAEAAEADLIVLGSSHRNLLGELTGRKTVQRLLHGAPCAVATAPAGFERRDDRVQRIVAAYDGSPESRYALRAAYGIADRVGASVLVCGVVEPIGNTKGFAGIVEADRDASREEDGRVTLGCAAARAPDGVEVSPRLLWGDPATELLDLARAEADLLVAGSRGYGELHRVLAGGVSGALLGRGVVATLVTPRVVVAASAPVAKRGRPLRAVAPA